VRIKIGPPSLTEEKHRVYVNYLKFQHNTTDNSSVNDFHRFLYRTAVNTLEFEYRLQDRLMAVGILDLCSRSLSSVYTYFDPEFSSRSPGSFSALKEILYCRDKAIAHYYLGYYVADCPAMNYKTRFKPHEFLDPEGTWIPHNA
jgi:arginine-tRNA-protein transferase